MSHLMNWRAACLQKNRTWHWTEDDRLIKRTVIREHKVA